MMMLKCAILLPVGINLISITGNICCMIKIEMQGLVELVI